MGAFTGLYDDEVVVRIPPASPSRRDYQLRSVSPSPSRPESPWRPRGSQEASSWEARGSQDVSQRGSQDVSQRGSQEIDTFRMYDSYPPAARSSYYSGPLPSAPQGSSSFYSGPLPSAPQGVDRSYYSGPLPPPSSGFSTTTGSIGSEGFDFEFASWAKSYHRGDSVDADDDEPSSFYLSNPAESRARANAEFAERAGRSCELGLSEAVVRQKSEVARGYKSGEIPGLQICADGIYNSSGSCPSPAPTAAWDALMKDAKKDLKDDNADMVAIPFKWEEVSCQPRESVSKKPSSRSSSKPNSRAASVSQKPNSRSSSVSQKPKPATAPAPPKPKPAAPPAPPKPISRRAPPAAPVSQKPKPTWNMSTTPAKKSLKSEFSFGGSHQPQHDVVAPPVLKPLRTKSPKHQEVDTAPKSPFSVPFKWEEEPGKSKFETEEASKPEGPALQLPPRLALKRASTTPKASSTSTKLVLQQPGWVSEPESTTYVESSQQQPARHSSSASSKKFFDKDCFRRCRRLLVNLF